MPQLMPLLWVFSVFMILFMLLMVMIIYIVFLKMQLEKLNMNQYKIDLIWMW